MPIWGRKRKEAECALSESKKIIIKVKKKGFDTFEAEKLYKKGKRAIRNRRYAEAHELIKEANSSAKRIYVKGIHEKLSKRISELERKIRELEEKRFETKQERKLLNKAISSIKSGVKSYKDGLSAARMGIQKTEEKLQKINSINEQINSIHILLREIEYQNPGFPKLKDLRNRLKNLDELREEGEFESALKPAKKLHIEVKNLHNRHSQAYQSISVLEKVARDVEVLQAKIDAASKLKEAHTLLNQEKFDLASKMAKETVSELSSILNRFRESKHHVDLAVEKIKEAKGWGFSVFEAERDLTSAKMALDINHYEEAIEMAKEALEKASTVRQRHKNSLELIQTAKDEVAASKEYEEDILEYEVIIEEAEKEFERGDYGASDLKIRNMLKFLKDRH